VSPEVVNGEVNARVRFAARSRKACARASGCPRACWIPARTCSSSAALRRTGRPLAYVMDGRTAMRRPVELGVSSLGEVEIRSGLQPGDRIVVSGSDGDAQRAISR
jgi:HlyD family secretion protein